MSRSATNRQTANRLNLRHKSIGSLEPYGNVRSIRLRFEAFYRRMFADATLLKWSASPGKRQDDPDFAMAGIDALVFLPSGHAISVCEMYREKDFGDMLIEVWADHEKRFPGWARSEDFSAQRIAYAVDAAKAVYWIPTRDLRRACERYLQGWVDLDPAYPRISKRGAGVEAHYVAVPWRLISDAIGMEAERMVHHW